MQLILRTLTSPYNDITKGSVLSHQELDENQINLKGELIYTAYSESNNIVFKKTNGDEILLPEINLSDQNNTWREVFLGTISTFDDFNTLFNQELIVTDTENVMLVFAFDNSTEIDEVIPVIYRYKWANGKGTYNPIPNVIGEDILFENSAQVTGGDIITIINGANTQTYDLGDIGTDTIVDYINNNGPYDLTDTELVYYFIYESDGITYLYQFIGTNGTYGDGETPITDEDLKFITSSDVEPVVIPTKTSDLTNDGEDGVNPFITLADVPLQDLQGVINVDKNADKVRFYHEEFPITDWSAFVYMITVVPSETDDKFYTYGDFSFGGIGNDIARFNADGTYDTTFNVGTGLNLAPFAGCDILPLSDGKLYVSGFFTNYNGTPANRIIKLNNDGSIDTSFDYGTGFTQFTTGLALDSNNKLYVGARNTAAYQGVATGGICRINTNGTRDNTFDSGGGFNNSVIDIKVDSSDRVYVTGYFTTYQGTTARGIVRLNPDGSINNGFVYGTGTDNAGNNIVNQIELIQIEGKILLYGMLTGYNGTPANRIIKLNEDGTVEPDFLTNMGTGFNDRVFEAKITSYGTILCTGSFTSYNGVATNRSIELNLDGTIYKAFPQSLLYNAYLLNNDVFLGLTLENEIYTLSSIIDYYPVNFKTLTFDENTGKAEYKIGGLASTSEEELLPKRLIREFIEEEILESNFSNQNNTWREVFLGFYSNKTEFNNLFNQDLIVTDTENVMLVYGYQNPDILVTEPSIIYRYKWANGKGTYNPIPNVIGEDILFESVSQVTVGDIITIINGANTQTYDLGDIGTDTIVDYINNNGPYDLTDTELVYYFIYESDDITYLYQFIGTNGTYGDGETPITDEDLKFITSSDVEPVVGSDLQTTLQNGNTTNLSAIFQNEGKNTIVEGGEIRVNNPIEETDIYFKESGIDFAKGLGSTSLTFEEPTVEGVLIIPNNNGTLAISEDIPLNYSFRLFQTGTGDPNPNDVYDNLRINPFDNTQTIYRDVFFERLGVGSYRLNLFSKEPDTSTNFDKISITFGDGSVRLDASFNNTTIGGISYRQYTFKTYNVTGTLADDLLTGVFCTITLYP